MSFNWKDTLVKIAPYAGTMIGGPWGGLAAKAIGAVFGHESETPPDEAQMSEYISKATPEQLVQLKQIDADLKIKNKELGIKDDELVYNDRANARATHKDSRMPAVIVISLTVMVVSMVVALFIYEPPGDNKALLYSICGQILTAWGASIAYFVGTTKSSAEKTRLMSLK